eukprot:CAMPEP_0119414304 /NCGR_PEP_ID=MMETSP1335-20130426/6781_1 /TAXON_ID=259385 /ORGANISM="Chrysoculter rhomboideus, Strain RCC1486" /LENGTH=259 /DNA_ID=CAMNT_0007439177 /DNA_START=70 /DNA_END=849 /DNA_ORIENTATION=+
MPEVSHAKARKLGTGHFASVYMTRHNGEVVAAKEFAKGTDITAELVIKDLHHRNIVRFIELLEKDDSVWVMTELLRVSVSDVVKYSKPSRRVAFAFTGQLLDALVYLHGRGIAHRDIKLENLMLDPDTNLIKLIDFGLATIGVGQVEQPAYATLEYAAPEVLAKRPHDPYKADVWSAGVCAFTMFVGQFPFERADDADRFFRVYAVDGTMDLTDAPPPPAAASTVRFCRRVLCVDPKQRPSAAAARRLLGGALLGAMAG